MKSTLATAALLALTALLGLSSLAAGLMVRRITSSLWLGVAAQVMRRILVDHARRYRAEKRGGEWEKLQLDAEEVGPNETRSVNLVALDDALQDLARFDARQSQVVEMRFFGGLTNEEVGEVLASSPRTVKREWRMARAWLHREVCIGENDGAGG